VMTSYRLQCRRGWGEREVPHAKDFRKKQVNIKVIPKMGGEGILVPWVNRLNKGGEKTTS